VETFELVAPQALADGCLDAWRDFAAAASFPVTWESKKGPRGIDAKTLVTGVEIVAPATVRFTCSFEQSYVSPLRLAEAVCPRLVRGRYAITKTAVAFADGTVASPDSMNQN
jgi:hypothetical protein